MLRPVDNFYLQQEEPFKSCLQFLRKHILDFDEGMTEKWQYGMPFYYYHDKRCCYLWIHKKYKQPYIGVVDGKEIEFPGLISEARARMKILLVDPQKNIPVQKINRLMKTLIKFYS